MSFETNVSNIQGKLSKTQISSVLILFFQRIQLFGRKILHSHIAGTKGRNEKPEFSNYSRSKF